MRKLFATEHWTGLFLRWSRPVGSMVEKYRIERTRDGHDYELVGETGHEQFLVPRPPLREPWFYRVTAWNALGAGSAKWIYFFQRRIRGRDQRHGGSRLQLVPLLPGARVEICELIREGEPPNSGDIYLNFVRKT